MRDFTLLWGWTLGLVQCLWTELPTASGPKSARMYCGYRPGHTRVTPPSRQDDGNVRAPALSRAVCAVVQVVAVGRVRWWSFNRQSCVSARNFSLFVDFSEYFWIFLHFSFLSFFFLFFLSRVLKICFLASISLRFIVPICFFQLMKYGEWMRTVLFLSHEAV